MKLIGNYYSMLTLWIPVKDKDIVTDGQTDRQFH